MKITKNINLTDFEFWSGAKTFADKLTYNELNSIQDILEDENTNFTETEINDLFWFDDEYICELLNLDIDEIYNR